MNIFPLELVDNILGYLLDSKSTLSACTLVSQSWSPFAQQRLFFSTKVTRHNITRLTNTVANNPHLHRYIRKLHLADSGSGMSLSNAIPQLLVFQKCNLLSTLVIDGLEIISPEMASFFQSSFPQITTLKCSNTLFQTGRQLAVFLGSFPELQELQLQNVDFFMTMGDFTDPVSSKISTHIGVFKADMRYKYQVAWLNDWIAQQRPPVLHSLLLPRLPTNSALASHDPQTSPCAETVQELEIQSCAMDDATMSSTAAFNLLPYKQLRRLRLGQLSCPDIDNSASPAREYTLLSRIFSGIGSTCMQSVDVDLVETDLWSVDELDWDALDQMLATPRFSKLENLNITVQAGTSFIDFVPLIRTWLPKCSARGILNVQEKKTKDT